MKFVKVIGNLLLLISFFLPWIDAMITTFNGFQLPKAVNDLIGMTGDNSGAVILYVLYLIPLLSIIYLILLAMNKPSRGFGILTGLVSLFILGYMMVKGGSNLINTLQYGFYLCLVGAAIVFVSSFFGNRSTYEYKDFSS